MPHRTSTDEQHRLENALRQEAQANRPNFSEQLHERICRAAQQDTSPTRPLPAPSWRQRLVPLTVAAALVVGVSLTTWWFTRLPEDAPAVAESSEPAADPFELADQTGQVAEQLGRLIDSALSQQQWGYLDHDLQLATQLFMQQIPLTQVAEDEFPSEPPSQSPQETAG